MAALLALGLNINDFLLGSEVKFLALESEARDANHTHAFAIFVLGGSRDGAVDINPAILRELGIQSDAEQTVLHSSTALLIGRQFSKDNGFLAVGLVHFNGTAQFGIEDAAIGSNSHLHGIFNSVLPLSIDFAVGFEDNLAEGTIGLGAAGLRGVFFGGGSCLLPLGKGGCAQERQRGDQRQANEQRVVLHVGFIDDEKGNSFTKPGFGRR